VPLAEQDPAARRAYEIAIGLERDPAVRRFLQQRQSTLAG
jgi:RNA polymerase sigma-70 factor (ECF subfamily)